MTTEGDNRDPDASGSVTRDRSVQRKSWLEYLVLFAIAFVGLELKKPFGLVLHHIMGRPESPPSLYSWLSGDAASLLLVALACLLHSRSGLPAAPWLEKQFFKGPQGPLTILGPGLRAALVCAGIFAISQFVQAQIGIAVPLGTQINSGIVSHGDMVRLLAAFPLAVIGAPLSEEMTFRFAILSILLGLASFARPGPTTRIILFWSANFLQAFWFGFGHVHEGLVAGHGSSILLATLTAQQTWAGLVFGYVFRRFGI